MPVRVSIFFYQAIRSGLDCKAYHCAIFDRISLALGSPVRYQTTNTYIRILMKLSAQIGSQFRHMEIQEVYVVPVPDETFFRMKNHGCLAKRCSMRRASQRAPRSSFMRLGGVGGGRWEEECQRSVQIFGYSTSGASPYSIGQGTQFLSRCQAQRLSR